MIDVEQVMNPRRLKRAEMKLLLLVATYDVLHGASAQIADPVKKNSGMFSHLAFGVCTVALYCMVHRT